PPFDRLEPREKHRAGAVKAHPHGRELDAGQACDLLARQLLQLEENEKTTVLVWNPVERAVDELAGSPALEGLAGGGPPRADPPRAAIRLPTEPPPPLLLASPVAHRVLGDAIEPGAHFRVAAKLGQAPLGDEEDLVHDVLDVTVGAAEPPGPPR